MKTLANQTSSSGSAANISFEYRPDRIVALSGALRCVSRRAADTHRRHAYRMPHATIPAARSAFVEFVRRFACSAPWRLTRLAWLVAAAAAHPATRSRRHAVPVCGRARRGVLRRRAKDGKLQRVPPARASWAGDLRAFGKHNLLVSGATIVAEVFVYGHVRDPAPYSSRYCRERSGYLASAENW